MTYSFMTPFRVTSDGQNAPVAWKISETKAIVGAGDWIVIPQEAGALMVYLDASAGAGRIEETGDIDAVLAGTTPSPIVTWPEGTASTEIKSALRPATAAIRQVNTSGSTKLVIIAKKTVFAGEATDSSMAAVPATGSIALAAGNFADGDIITIPDGLHTPVVFEADSGAKASGTATVASGNVSDGDTVNLHGKTFEFDDGVAAHGSITLLNQPTAGKIITINDGVNAASVFEWDGVGANINVAIGLTKEASATALHAAINAVVAGLAITSANTTPGKCDLTNDAKGIMGNVAITTNDNPALSTIVGMTGGLAAGSGPVTSGNIPVAIGANASATVDNLITALKANLALDNTATVKDTPGAGAYRATIVWSVVGTVGNDTVTVVGTNLTKTNVTGGLDAGTAITPGRTGVAIGATNLLSLVNLAAAIAACNAANTLDITTVNAGAGSLALTNDRGGVAGNVTITKTGANITVTGMTGGKDAVTMRGIYDLLAEIADNTSGA